MTPTQEEEFGIYKGLQSCQTHNSGYCSVSTPLRPRFHTIDKIRHHMGTLVEDVSIDAFTFCVSQAAGQSDLLFGYPCRSGFRTAQQRVVTVVVSHPAGQ
jgi:hypothetical protein